MYKIKIKLLLVVFFCALVQTGTSNAMLASIKQQCLACCSYFSHYLPNYAQYSNKSNPILPFESAKEKQKEYERLADTEKYLFDSKKTDIKDSEKEKHHDNVKHYWERLTRDRVKKDIENREPYTLVLGLKEKDGIFTMERRPINGETDRKLHNALLFLLSIDPKNTDLGQHLKEFYQKIENPSKSAEILFPKVIALKDNTTELSKNIISLYKYNNTINIRYSNLLIANSRDYLHEDWHAKQKTQGIDGMGGLLPRPIGQWNDDSEYPLFVAWEKDAEDNSIKNHPHPKQLLKKIALSNTMALVKQLTKLRPESLKRIEEDLYGIVAKQFPYLKEPNIYAGILQHFKFEKNGENSKIIDLFKKAYDTIDKKIKIAAHNKKLSEQPDPMGLIKESITRKKIFDELSNKLLNELSTQKIEAKNYLAGSTKFYEVREKLGLMPKE